MGLCSATILVAYINGGVSAMHKCYSRRVNEEFGMANSSLIQLHSFKWKILKILRCKLKKV